ncbi:processed acidic surface protein [Oceanobacillus oncorhynchi]|uniref:processed acidic surface protein n=1 Tax=Oceanobacillus oncorhynchi TaxID=545501 RepID=UPI002116D85D|nr:processed acidic surface protein [Oceanobacillus oncorhynchi]UUI39802.1 processed acidic surface protein [Oceanobacillus oncorhynchi]
MRKSTQIFALFLFLFVVLPGTADAQSNSFQKDLENYLTEISEVRGFTVTKEDIAFSLSLYDFYLEDFDTVTDLKDFLGEVIHQDGNNLKQIYSDYNIDQSTLRATLAEFGETLEDYIFLDDLYMNTDYYLYNLTPREPDFDQKLADYLAEATAIRGFQVTSDHVENALALYGSELNDFKTVDELSDFLGEIIHKDLSNVGPYFEMATEDVLQLISDNGLDIHSYVFLDDLFNDLDGEIIWEEDFFDLSFFMEEFDLTEDELLRLEEHIRSIPDITSDETIARMLNLAERMMAFSDFEKATELTPGQATELLSIFHELIDIFQFHVEFVLVTDEGEEPITLQTLFSLTKLENTDLKANIYNLQGDFLADLIISGEIVDADTIIDTGNAIQKEADKKTEPSVITSPDKEPPATEETSYVKESPKTAEADVDMEAASTVESDRDKKEKLPDTASNYAEKGIWGLAFIAAGGFLLFLARRRKQTV